MNTLGGGGTCAGRDATGVGTTLGGSIAVGNGGGFGMGVGALDEIVQRVEALSGGPSR